MFFINKKCSRKAGFTKEPAFYYFRYAMSIPLTLFLIRFGRVNQKDTDEQSHDIENNRQVKHILIAHRIDLVTVGIRDKVAGTVYNQIGNLVAGQSCKCPCGQGNSVDGADTAHAVVVGKQSRYIGEAAAVACVYNKD